LALHDFFAGLADILAADVEVAALADRGLIDRRHRQLRRFRPRGRRGGGGKGRQERNAGHSRNETIHRFPPPGAAAIGWQSFVPRQSIFVLTLPMSVPGRAII
jgi:hypothetical protein